MRSPRSIRAVGAIAAAALVFVAAAAGYSPKSGDVARAALPNEVSKWNEIAQNTVLAQAPNASAPPAAFVFMAMVQGSVYGAVNAIDREHRPYLVMERADPDASKEAAVATAAFRVLDTVFPAQHAALQAAYDGSLGAIPDGPMKDGGIAVGAEAATAMLAEGHDGRSGPIPPLPPQGPGFWEPLLTGGGVPILDPSPWVALAEPFLVKSSSQFRTDGPYALTSDEYAADFNEVKALGDVDSAVRTAEQTHIAIFWQSNPAATWNSVARRLAGEQELDITESAVLFGLLNLSAADASINCWNDKYHYGFWRPIAAIREADTDGNPATEPDPTWAPFFLPPYPDHPSGANCFGASSLSALKAYFGDETPFYVTSAQFPGEQRPFERFSDAISEIIEARIWGGLHFRNADVQGATLGKQVVRYAKLHYFQPMN